MKTQSAKKYIRPFFFIFPFVIGFILTNYFQNQHHEPALKLSGAKTALNFWAQQRAYPYEEVPSSKYATAFEKKKRLNKGAQDLEGEWTAIGPKNFGGRTISLAINNENPSTLYAGSASGGLWRTYTEGKGAQAWERIPIGFPVLGVSSIAISPADTNIMLIGTGEVYNNKNSTGGTAIRETRGSYGIGILKTTDAGKTWRKTLDWSLLDKTCVWSIRFNPLNPNIIYAGTTEGTYKSFDAGETWSLIDPTIMVTDIYINPNDTNIVMLACGNLLSAGHGIYRSTDAGNSFSKITSSAIPLVYGGKAVFSYSRNFPNVVYLSIGNGYWSKAGTWLVKSSDSGANWITQSTFDYSTYQGWFAHFAVVHPANVNRILCAGVDIYKSENGGLSMSQKSYWYKWYLGYHKPGEPEGPSDYSHADHHVFVQHPYKDNVVYFGNDGGIFVTDDFGETFEGRNGGYQTQQFYNGFSSSYADSNTALGGMQDNATAIYYGQDDWLRGIGGDGSWTAASDLAKNVLYGSWQYLGMMKSTNGGLQWSIVSPPDFGQSAFIAPFVISSQNSNIIYAGRSIVYKTTNGGSSWLATNGGVELDNNLPISMAISRSDDNIVVIGFAPTSSRAKLFKTVDGGNNWTNITGDLPDRYPTDIHIDDLNPDNIFVTFSGFDAEHVFKSENGGSTWASIDNGLPNVPHNAIISDPENVEFLYVGNDLGVWFSDNGGTNWLELNDGLIDAVMVSNLTVSPLNNKIRVSTHGNGAFERALIKTTSLSEKRTTEISGFSLLQNYPNPFNPSTNIEFHIPYNSHVKISVYDIKGEKLMDLINEIRPTGTHTIKFNSHGLASGTYIYKLTAGNFHQSKKMIVLK